MKCLHPKATKDESVATPLPNMIPLGGPNCKTVYPWLCLKSVKIYPLARHIPRYLYHRTPLPVVITWCNLTLHLVSQNASHLSTVQTFVRQIRLYGTVRYDGANYKLVVHASCPSFADIANCLGIVITDSNRS